MRLSMRQSAQSLMVRCALALSTLWLAGCQAAGPRLEAYANPAKGVAFSYPAEWVVIDLASDETITLATDANLQGVNPDLFEGGDSVIVLGVAVLAPTDLEWNALTFVKSLTAQLGNSAELEMIDEAALKTLGGSEFAVTAFRAVSPERPDEASIFFLASRATGELSLLVLGETSRDGADAFRPVFEAVLASLTISQPVRAPASGPAP